MNAVVTVWTGDFGEYVVPPRFENVAMTLSGWPDRRYNAALRAEFFAWVAEQEDASKTDASGARHG